LNGIGAPIGKREKEEEKSSVPQQRGTTLSPPSANNEGRRRTFEEKERGPPSGRRMRPHKEGASYPHLSAPSQRGGIFARKEEKNRGYVLGTEAQNKRFPARRNIQKRSEKRVKDFTTLPSPQDWEKLGGHCRKETIRSAWYSTLKGVLTLEKKRKI